MSPTVACVVPTHRRPDLLRDALASIAEQRRAPEEVLVVDDAIDPATRQVVDSMRDLLPITYVPNPTPGVSASRNLGARQATGDLLAFLDDDDRWRPDYLERAMAVVTGDAATVVVTWSNFFRGEFVWSGRRMPTKIGIADAIVRNPGVTGSNLLIDRELYLSLGGFDEDLPVSNDKDLFVRLLQGGHAYSVLQQPLVERRLHEGPRIGTASQVRVEGLRRFFDRYRHQVGPRERRLLRAEIVRVQGSVHPHLLSRVFTAAKLLVLVGPRGLLRMHRIQRTRTPCGGAVVTGQYSRMTPGSRRLKGPPLQPLELPICARPRPPPRDDCCAPRSCCSRSSPPPCSHWSARR